MPVVFVPKLGNVTFPDNMSAADITSAIEKDILPKITEQENIRQNLADVEAGTATSKPQGPPVSEQERARLSSMYEAATPEQRQKMLDRTDYIGQFANFLDEQYKAKDAEIAKLGTAVKKEYQITDPRREARIKEAMRQGADLKTAENLAGQAAIEGLPPEQPVAQAKPSDFDFDLKAQYKDAPALVRGAVKGYYGYKQGVLGLEQAAADLIGADEFSESLRRNAKQAMETQEIIGEAPATSVARNFEGAVSSIAQNIPTLLLGAVTGGESLVLGSMMAQSFGQEYTYGRDKGLDKTDAAARGALFAIADGVGERLGLPNFMKNLKGSLANKSFNEATDAISEYILKQIPGEELTTGLQFLTDKYPNFGLNPKATFSDYLSQATDTLVQTIMQGGMMLGGVKATQLATTGQLKESGAAEAARAEGAKEQALRKWEEQGFTRPKFAEQTQRQEPFVGEEPPPAPKAAAKPAAKPVEPAAPEDEILTPQTIDYAKIDADLRKKGLLPTEESSEDLDEDEINERLRLSAELESKQEEIDPETGLPVYTPAPRVRKLGKTRTESEQAKLELTQAKRNLSKFEAEVRGVESLLGEADPTNVERVQELRNTVAQAQQRYAAVEEKNKAKQEQQAAAEGKSPPPVEPVGPSNDKLLEDLGKLKDDLLTSSGKPPMPNTPARKKYDEVQSAYDEIEQLKAQNEEISAKPGADVVRLTKLLGPKLYGSLENLPKVTVKELFQNSFDGIKPLLESGAISEGKINIGVNEGNRTIEMVDNGTGMAPNILATKFLEIAGTQKETESASGGLGIAKMQFLFGNKNIKVITVRDGKVSTLETTGPDLEKALSNPDVAPKITVEPWDEAVAKNKQLQNLFPDNSGTYVKIGVPETFHNPDTGKDEPIELDNWSHSYPSLRTSPLFRNVDVNFHTLRDKTTLFGALTDPSNNYSYSESVPVGKNFPIDEHSPLTTVKFGWGDAVMYVTREPEQYEWNQSRVHVLSNGIYQFTQKIDKGPKYNFYLDIHPKVKAEDPGYPFDLNRQRFSPAVAGDFDKIFNYVKQLYDVSDLQNNTTNYGTVRYLEPSGPTQPETLSPPLPAMEVPTNLLRPGDSMAVINGKLEINGRPVPEITSAEASSFKIDLNTLVIPQDQLRTDAPILNDNLLIKDKQIPFTELMESEFGPRFYSYMRELGEAFMELRDVVAKEMGYDKYNSYKEVSLDKEVIGISFDIEYRGVSTRVPFWGMYLNPAAVSYGNKLFSASVSPERAASAMFGTMVHELAHHEVRSHNEEFPAEMQKISAFLAVPNNTDFDLDAFLKNLRGLVARNSDIQSEMERVFNEGVSNDNLSPIGNRLKEAGSYQTTARGPASDLGSDGYTARSYEKLPEGPAEGAGSAGKQPRPKRVPKQAKVTPPEPYQASSRSGRGFFSRISKNYTQYPKWNDVRREVSALLRTAPSKTRRAVLGALPNYQVIDLAGMEFDVLDVEKGRRGFRTKLPQFDVLTAKIGELEALRKRIETSGAKILERSKLMYANKQFAEAVALEEKIELEATASEVDPDTDTSNAYLNGLWGKLGRLPGGEQAKQIYRDRLKFYKVMFNNVRTYMEGEMYRTYRMAGESETAAKTKAKSYVEKIMPVIKGPYFHMFRVGQFWYQYNLPDVGKGFEMFESEAERNAELDIAKDAYREKLKEQGVKESEIEAKVDEAFFDAGNGFSEVFNDAIGMKIAMDRVKDIVSNSIDKQLEKVSANPDAEADEALNKAKTAITNELQQLILQLAPTGSLRKMFARRKLRAGANPDMQRSFADSVLKVSNFFPKVVYAKDMYAALRSAREYVKSSTSSAEEKAVAKDYIKEMELRTDQVMSPPNRPLPVRLFQTLNFYQYLSSVASSVLNFVGGNIQAASILFGEYPVLGIPKLIQYNFKHRAAVAKQAPNGLFSIGIEFNKKLDPDIKKARDRMVAENVFNVSQMYDVATTANTPSDKQQGIITTGLNAIAVPFHLSERLMRESGALAHFDLSHEKYLDKKNADGSKTFDEEEAFERAYQDAVNFTRRAFGEPSTLQRGRYFKDWRALPLQFKSFVVQQTIFQYQLLTKALQLSAKKERERIVKDLGEDAAKEFDKQSAEMRWQAIRTLSAIVLLSYAFTGLKGTPFWWLISKLIGLIHALYSDNDEEVPFDADNFLMNWLEEHVPELGGATIGRGWVAKKLNIATEGRLVYDIPSLWVSEEGSSAAKTNVDAVKNFILGMLGPTTSYFQDWAAAIDLWSQGKYERGIEIVLPAGVRSLLVAIRVANEGEKTRSGKQLISKDEVTEADILYKAFGFEPEDWKRKKSTIFEIKSKDIAIRDRRQEILDQAWMAYQETDPEIKKELMDKVLKRKADFNALYGSSPAYRLPNDAIRKTIKSRAKQQAIAQRQGGINVDRKAYPMLEGMGKYGRFPSELGEEEDED
jgi:hypothetical protein